MTTHPGIKGDRNEKQRLMTTVLFHKALSCSFLIFLMLASLKKIKINEKITYLDLL